MSALVNLTQSIMREPSPDVLWGLQPILLAVGTPEAEAARQLAGEFYAYLSQVRSKLTSKGYSSLAAKLAAGAVGTLSLQEFMESLADDRHKTIVSLLGGGLASSFELLSTFQHVKAWESEFSLEHDTAAWTLYAEWWHVSCEAQPGLSAQERAGLIDRLLAHVRDPQTPSQARMLLVISLYQVLMLIRLAPLLVAEAGKAQA